MSWRRCWLVTLVVSSLPAIPAADPGPAARSDAAPASRPSGRWPTWRGPGSTGCSPGDGHAVRFSATEGLAWKRELPGAGRSTPIVWDDHIILTTPANGQDAVLDLDGSGQVRWLAALGKERPGKHRNASGSNPSPVTDGSRIFAYFKSGTLAALDFSGSIIWRTNLQERFGKDTLWWDVGTSPVLAGKRVVIAVLHTGESYLAAFEGTDGKLAWKVSRNHECAVEGDQSYATPLVCEQRGREALIVWGGEHVTGHDASDGSTLWTCAGFNPERVGNWVTVASPVLAAGNVIVPYGRGALLAGIRADGEGDVTATHRAWTRPEAAAFVPSPATDGKKVWVLRDRGEVQCLDARTGDVVWTKELPESRSSYYASPTIVGSRLYAAREDGVVFVVDIAGEPEVLASNDMGERIIASPVPVDGRLLLRGERHLFCVAPSEERGLRGDAAGTGRPVAEDPATTTGGQPAFPVRVSPDGRYFVDSSGKPLFWLGTTQWELFRGYRIEEARTILEKSRSHGFTFVQVKLLGQGDGSRPNAYGEAPLLGGDARTPNEAYFRNVDAVVRAARENDLVISMTIYHQAYRGHIPFEKARAWARWLAERYRDAPNIVWSSTPEATREFVPILRELAAGLREGDPLRRLITFKPDPAPAPSSSFIHEEEWLDFNSMQVWNAVRQIYPMVTGDRARKPAKPTLMAEGAYEAGSEYGFEVTPLWVRRQAWYSYLAGGHHTYGHNDSWRILPTWKEALDAPGARQMGILRKTIEALPEWWLLEPDPSILASGGKTEGDVLHLAARHGGGRRALVYLADPAEVSVDLRKLGGSGVEARWIDPRTGDASPIGRLAKDGSKAFSTPSGWEDALLVLEAAAGGGRD